MGGAQPRGQPFQLGPPVGQPLAAQVGAARREQVERDVGRRVRGDLGGDPAGAS